MNTEEFLDQYKGLPPKDYDIKLAMTREFLCKLMEDYASQKIQMPKDEEIKDASYNYIEEDTYKPSAGFHFIEGAKWLKDEIIRRNK